MSTEYGGPDLPENRPLRELVEAAVGAVRVVQDISRAFGRRSITWRVTTGDGQTCYLKRHEHRQHYLAEVTALENWVPVLPEAEWWTAPRLLSQSPELGAMVMTSVDGRLFDEMTCFPSRITSVYELAGRFAALVHTAAIDAGAAGKPRDYDQTKIARLLDGARPYLRLNTVDWIEKTLMQADLWRGLRIVPVHADFSPRNWVVTESPLRIGVIDWERARPGYWLEDVHFMWYRYWGDEPQRAKAFCTGYGRSPTDGERRQVCLIVLINAVGGLSWALDHGDTDFAAVNRALIRTCRTEISQGRS